MIERLGLSLADWLVPVNAWTAALLACALLLDRTLARRTRASLRIALYAPVALRVLVPPSWSLHVAPASRLALVMPGDVLSASSVSGHALPWGTVVAVVYVAVAAAIAGRALLRRFEVARAVASAEATCADAPCAVLRHPELGPMVVGVISPRIVLPEALVDGANGSTVACVLRHEIAHVRRRDPWLSAAIEALLVVAWPVVPLWIAAARVRHLVELACDEAALEGANAVERRHYGHVLLDVAEQGTIAFAGAGALHFGSTLRARIEAIALHRPWPRAAQVALVTVAVAGFAACSSAAPTTLPQPADGTHPAAAGKGLDEYGYQYDDDPMNHAAKAEPPPASTRNADGRLAPELIQGVVRRSFGAFRSCYEAGAKAAPGLEGTVTVSFHINPDGTVSSADGAQSTLPDANVVRCVVAGFQRLTFPPPEGSYVTVVYPIVFSPGN
jgi:TonB family protein